MKKISALDQAIELILHYIEEKKLLANEKLPSERWMSQEWCINRVTLRSALKKLQNLNKITIVPNIGAFVIENKIIRNIQDADSITENIISQHKRLETIVLVKKRVPADEIVASKLKINTGDDVFYLRRLRTVDDIPYIIENTFISTSYIPFIDDYDFSKTSLYNVFEMNQMPIEKGKEIIKFDMPDEEICEYLKIEQNQLVFITTGTSCIDNEQPIEYFESISRSKGVIFSGKLTR